MINGEKEDYICFCIDLMISYICNILYLSFISYMMGSREYKKNKGCIHTALVFCLARLGYTCD